MDKDEYDLKIAALEARLFSVGTMYPQRYVDALNKEIANLRDDDLAVRKHMLATLTLMGVRNLADASECRTVDVADFLRDTITASLAGRAAGAGVGSDAPPAEKETNIYQIGFYHGKWHVEMRGGRIFEGATLREAIDAARKTK